MRPVRNREITRRAGSQLSWGPFCSAAQCRVPAPFPTPLFCGFGDFPALSQAPTGTTPPTASLLLCFSSSHGARAWQSLSRNRCADLRHGCCLSAKPTRNSWVPRVLTQPFSSVGGSFLWLQFARPRAHSCTQADILCTHTHALRGRRGRCTGAYVCIYLPSCTRVDPQVLGFQAI